jgi:hypothetical protein
MNPSYEDKLKHIAKAYNEPLISVQLTANHMTGKEVDQWLDNAAIRMANQVVALVMED